MLKNLNEQRGAYLLGYQLLEDALKELKGVLPKDKKERLVDLVIFCKEEDDRIYNKIWEDKIKVKPELAETFRDYVSDTGIKKGDIVLLKKENNRYLTDIQKVSKDARGYYYYVIDEIDIKKRFKAVYEDDLNCLGWEIFDKDIERVLDVNDPIYIAYKKALKSQRGY